MHSLPKGLKKKVIISEFIGLGPSFGLYILYVMVVQTALKIKTIFLAHIDVLFTVF